MPRVAAGARSQPQAAAVLLRRRDTHVPLQPWPRAREENSGVGGQPWLAVAAPRRWGTTSARMVCAVPKQSKVGDRGESLGWTRCGLQTLFPDRKSVV